MLYAIYITPTMKIEIGRHYTRIHLNYYPLALLFSRLHGNGHIQHSVCHSEKV